VALNKNEDHRRPQIGNMGNMGETWGETWETWGETWGQTGRFRIVLPETVAEFEHESSDFRKAFRQFPVSLTVPKFDLGKSSYSYFHRH